MSDEKYPLTSRGKDGWAHSMKTPEVLQEYLNQQHQAQVDRLNQQLGQPGPRPGASATPEPQDLGPVPPDRGAGR